MEENEPKISKNTATGELQGQGSSQTAITQPTDSGTSDMVPRTQLLELQEENRKMLNNFNAQRAKLKELFVQKEQELNAMKSKLTVMEIKAQEEISSLQQLVQETVEESAICKSELELLKQENQHILQENRQLQESLHSASTSTSQELSSLAPQVLNQVKKTIARIGKSGDPHNPSAGDTATDDANKSKNEGKYSQEDSEVLGSIVTQLQEEMKALKEKLREADEKLHTTNTSILGEDEQANTTKPLSPVTCENCNALEKDIEILKTNEAAKNEKLEKLKKQLEEIQKELEKEAELRAVLENQWQEKREAHKNEVHVLREQVTSNEQQLLELQQKFLETKDEVSRQLQRLGEEREKVNKHLELLQADNDFLSGRYLATAEEIESQYINLPNNVEELQEIILRQQQDLIQARLGCDYEKKRCVTSLDEIQILRDQLEASNSERTAYKKKVQTEIRSLQDRITQHMMTLQNCESAKVALERKEAEQNRQISAFRVEIIELNDQNEKLTKSLADAKTKIKNLQDDLATSEEVQKDFVQLSQTLQMNLEQLRHSDSEVRWQDDDDVSNCPACKSYFTVTVRKIHCRHCGHIYCDKCITKTVQSGPRKRPARVCDICHTLLKPHIAPYFSQESAVQSQQAASNNT
ncbi:rab GTPase-binding effector protein 1-like [Musca domestica]|uniref:Rab GTPase-binding effector protein 1-like n=1 Tax=Musca domestica TaxID=7370 RepID=A0ABM3V1Z7_MUSDO|nr:rab GTPase-binding effector protein 1-like [Musca domestica]